MRVKITSLTIFLFLLGITGYTQNETLIRIQIHGLKDTVCMIGNYYGNNTYIKDTLKVDGSGRCTLKSKDLPGGMYILIVSEKNYCDFIINNDRRFSMETDVTDLTGKMVIKDSPENKLFYQYLDYNKIQFKKAQELQDRIKASGENSDTAKALNDQIQVINKAMIDYKYRIIKEHPESFLALMLKVMKEPDIKENPTLPNGKKDSTYSYRTYVAEYWDGVNLADDRILRTPVFYNKLKKYLDNVIIQTPDTIMKAINQLAERARPNEEMFKYLIWFTTYHYESSEIMGFDRIFVNIVDTYYATGQTPWIAKSVNESIIKKANKLRPILIGNKAPNMIMQDTSFNLVSMHSIKARYLILLFWDPECSHCEVEVPKIREFYLRDKSKYGLEIFSVCSDTSMVKMKAGIRKKNMTWINVNGPRTLTGNYHDQYDIFSTPVVYVLNEQKEIIAKRLLGDQLEQFIINYDKKLQGKKN